MEDDFVMVNHDGNQQSVSSPLLDSIRQWLSPTEFDSEGSEYRKHLNNHAPATGDWLFQTEQYQKWHDSDDTGVLWIKGMPGSGKSVIAANLINVTQRENAPLLFFFARRILALNSDPKCLLRDCLFQALGYSALLPVELQSLMARFPDVEQVPFKDLSAVLTAILPSFPKIYLVFDAMDELTADQGTVLELLQLGQLKPSSVKVAITSRHVPPGSQPKNTSLLDLQLAKKMIAKDISSYITQRMGLQEKRQLSSDDRSAIQDALSQKAQSLFLYARLMLDKVLQSREMINDQLDCLPSSLVDMYTDILNEHRVRSKVCLEFQVSLLSWITHSSRVLRLTELAVVVNSDPNRWGLADTQDAKLMIRSACGPLVEILDDETVQVIHHSFTEFLLDDGRVSSPRAFPSLISSDVHRNLTITCVDYLLSGCFDSWSLMTAEEEDDDYKISEERRAFMIRFPFLQYTYQNWPYHAARCDKLDTGLFETLDSFLKYGAHAFESWKAFWFSKEDTIPEEFHPLHVAAHSGLVSYTSYLLDRRDNADQLDSYGRSPLAYAAIGGHSETAAILMDRTTSLSTTDLDGLAPIHHASKGNHAEVVKGLLTAGADPMEPKSREDASWSSWSSSTTTGKTPMQYACELGNTEAAGALALHMDTRQKDDIHLHWAAAKGQADVLSVLLKYPEIAANINRKDEKGNTALYVASCYRNSATVRILLDHGADVRISSRNGSDDHEFTPLQGWARLQDQRMYDRTPRIPTEDMGNVLRLLVQAGCDINARCYDGETPLFAYDDQSLLGERHSKPAVEFVSLLLKHGADPRATDNRGNTVLHKASRCRERKQVVELLVKAGADINAINHEGLTPLITMAKQQIFDIRSFVDNGADVNKQDSDGNTALHHICTSWCLEREHIEEWLAFADPTIKNYDGNTCVYNFRWGNGGQGRVESIKLMMDKGLDLESKNIQGRTFLLAACEIGQHNFIHELLRLGANVTVTDFQNKSCLHLLLSGVNGHGSPKKAMDTIQFLVQAGVDINAIDYGGNTPFHDAVMENAAEGKLTTIIEAGGVANKRNNLGRTALHMAAALDSDSQSISRINFLLQPDLGIDIHQKDHEGLTAIHLAASVAPAHVCHLISVGADVRAEGFDGCTPLHCAAASGQSNVVGLLCQLYQKNSWDIDPNDSRACTPLHEAARSGSAECVYLLLQSGANPTAKNKYGQTPVHTAAEHRSDTLGLRNKRKNELLSAWDMRGGSTFRPAMDPDRLYGSKTSLGLGLAIAQEEETHMVQNVIRLLLSAGVDPTVRDNFRQTPYEVAVMLGCEGAVDVLSSHRHSVNSGTNALPSNSLADQWYLSRTRNAEDMVKQISPEYIKTHSILSTAIYLKNEHLLEALLEAGADPTATDTEGLTAVHKIAYWGLTSMMEIMAPYVEDLNRLSPPLLHVAALRDLSNTQMVNLLIKLGVDLNMMHHEEEGDKYAEDQRPNFYAAIHIFAAGKKWWHIPALQSLCEAGADIELSDRDGSTPLLCALSGHWTGKIGKISTRSTDSYATGFWRDQSLEVLLEHGANINALSSKGESTLTTAVTWKRGPKLIKKLLDHGADMSLGNVPVLFTVVNSHDVEATKLILDAGADPNTQYEPASRKKRRYGIGPEAETPLLAAASVASRDAPGSKKALARSSLIALLLEYGADPMMKFTDGQNTLHKIAYSFGFFGPLVTAAGVDFEAKDNDGRTPLLLTCSESFYTSTRRELVRDTVTELVLGGVNVNATDNKGLTALHLTAQNGSAETISLLISHGASISAVDSDGLTPLYYSLSNSFGFRKIQALLSAGADPLCTGPKGETALHLLAPYLMVHSPADQMEGTGCTDKTNYMAEYTELYRRFIDCGCDPNGRDHEGNTPLFPYLARVKERSDMIIVPPPDMGDVKRMLDLHDVFAVNNAGDTLLHVIAGRIYDPSYDDYDDGASDGDAVLLFKELLERGLDPRKENKARLSALDVATTYGKEAVLKLFERRDYQVE